MKKLLILIETMHFGKQRQLEFHLQKIKSFFAKLNSVRIVFRSRYSYHTFMRFPRFDPGLDWPLFLGKGHHLTTAEKAYLLARVKKNKRKDALVVYLRICE